MTRVTVIGAEGFVGSAFARLLSAIPGLDVTGVTRQNYTRFSGMESDVVIEAACNSKKYLAERQPLEDFELSVAHRLRTLRDFPANLHVHISSVDVYGDLSSPVATREDAHIGLDSVSRYGFHKLMAEQVVQHYAKHWLIIRLAGMVGPGLRKNPVYDILHGEPLRIHPDSQYQYMGTDDAARIVWMLVEQGHGEDVFNVCGDGLISPAEIASAVGLTLDLSALDSSARPRVVHINNEKIKALTAVPRTRETVLRFLNGWRERRRFEEGSLCAS